MHEASLCQVLLDLVLETITQQTTPVKKVTEIVCELGPFSCIEPTTLASCFELFAENTPCEGAKLTLTRSIVTYTCQECGYSADLRKRLFHCPNCGSDNIHFNGGHGLMLNALRVDTEE